MLYYDSKYIISLQNLLIFQVSGETSQSTDGSSKECPPVKATILVKNSVVKGYHAFKIKPPLDTQLIVDREYTNINDKDACLIWVPELTTFDSNLYDMVTDEQKNLKLSDIAGLPIGHVPRVLASCFYLFLTVEIRFILQ